MAGLLMAAVFPLALDGVLAAAATPSIPLGVFDGQSDVGSVSPPGTARFDAATGTYLLDSAGANTWYHIDGFHYLWKRTSGDLTLTADVVFPPHTYAHEPNPHRKGILMIRQSLDPGGAYIGIGVHGSGLTALQYRRERGANTEGIELNIDMPKTVRLEKRGDTFEDAACQTLQDLVIRLYEHWHQPSARRFGDRGLRNLPQVRQMVLTALEGACNRFENLRHIFAAVGAFGAVLVVRRVAWRPASVLLLCGLVGFDISSMWVHSANLLTVLRLLHGVTGGLLVGISYAVIARTRSPDRCFGALMVVQSSLGGPEQIGVNDGRRGAVDHGPLGLRAIDVGVALA